MELFQYWCNACEGIMSDQRNHSYSEILDLEIHDTGPRSPGQLHPGQPLAQRKVFGAQVEVVQLLRTQGYMGNNRQRGEPIAAEIG